MESIENNAQNQPEKREGEEKRIILTNPDAINKLPSLHEFWSQATGKELVTAQLGPDRVEVIFANAEAANKFTSYLNGSQTEYSEE